MAQCPVQTADTVKSVQLQKAPQENY